MLEQVRIQAQAMQRLVENLLDMARLQQGGVHLQREWLPLDEVVGSALRQTTRAPGPASREHRRARQPTAAAARCPALWSVLVNLLDNAAKYAGRHAAGHRWRAGRRTAAVRARRPGQACHRICRVETLFEPFTRGTAESTVSGIGLGLALVRGIVEAHGGRIEAAAARPAGTHLHATLSRPSSLRWMGVHAMHESPHEHARQPHPDDRGRPASPLRATGAGRRRLAGLRGRQRRGQSRRRAASPTWSSST
ncbi:KN motif and ankyrin repeat domain-containing protein 3 [Manis javanica]|nr:KN motif and ankyrin repeat domain-containing protein 3 [Manis javanica]